MAIEFTEAEMLMLASFGYFQPGRSLFDSSGKPINGPIGLNDADYAALWELATDGKYDRASMSGFDKYYYENALKSLTAKLKENEFVITKSIDHNTMFDTGFAAFAIEPKNNPDGEVIICCRGSDPLKITNVNDWIGADLALGWKDQTHQQAEIKQFMESFYDYDNITLTGHSLGGNLAMYGAVSFPYPDRIRSVYSFDGPGFNSEFIEQDLAKIERVNDKIYNYQQEHDLVSSSLTSIGRIIILESSIKWNGFVDVEHHNRWAISVNADQSLKRNESGSKDAVCNSWNVASTDASDHIHTVISSMSAMGTSFTSSVNAAVHSAIGYFTGHSRRKDMSAASELK